MAMGFAGNFRGALRIGLVSARANLAPMLILQSLAALMVVAYWVFPFFGNLFAPFAAWHAAWGWRAAFLCQAFFCGILPGLFLLLFRGIRPRRVGLTILAQAFWCGTFGIGVGEVFKLLAAWFGDNASLSTLLLKTAFDQFVWTVLVIAPANAVFYFWVGRDFSFARTCREWRTKCEAKVQGEGERRTVKFRGFRGKYRLSWTCSHCGRRHFQELWLTGDGDVRCGASTAEDECFVPVRSVTVDGRAPVWKVGEDILDLAALYPDAVEAGTDGTRWAEIACTLVAPRGGSYRLRRINDWWGRVIVNGEDQGALVGEADKGHPKVFEVKLRAGENRLLFKTRSGSGGQWIAGLFLPGDSTLTVK